jgi:hypothetical protein
VGDRWFRACCFQHGRFTPPPTSSPDPKSRPPLGVAAFLFVVKKVCGSTLVRFWCDAKKGGRFVYVFFIFGLFCCSGVGSSTAPQVLSKRFTSPPMSIQEPNSGQEQSNLGEFRFHVYNYCFQSHLLSCQGGFLQDYVYRPGLVNR